MAPIRENDQTGRSLDVGLLDSDKWTLSWIGFCSWEALKRDAHVPKMHLCVYLTTIKSVSIGTCFYQRSKFLSRHFFNEKVSH